MIKRVLGAVTVLALSSAALTGCSLTPRVGKADVEQQISTQLEKKVGRAPEKIECPGDLEGKVGVKMTCTLTDSGSSLDVFVTVTSVSGKDVKFDIEVSQP